MKKAEIVNALTQRVGDGATKSGVRRVLDELENLAVEQLTETGEFPVWGIANLKVEERKARQGQNPATGEKIAIPARQVIRARANKGLSRSLGL